MGFGFDRPWFPWLVLSVLLAILVAGGAYWRLGSRLGLRERIRLASLRALALVLLLGAWFAPSRIRAISEPIRAQVPILADRSMSMSIDDESEGQTRWELARQAAERLAQRLDERFDVRLYAFDRTLHLFSEEQEPIGRSTAILDTVRSAMEMAAGSPLAGVILLTDGIQTVGASEIPQDWPAPIFAVGLGSPMPPKDVALLHVEAEPVYYLGEVAEARVRVRAAGYPGRSFVVTLTQEGQPLTTARFSPESAESVQELQLQWRPEREGAFQYELAIAPLPDEFSPRNNRLSFTAQVLPGRIRVLLVDAGPRLDFALLRRTLQRLPMVEPTAVLLTPPEAPQTEEALPIRLGVYPLDGESPRLPAGPEEWNRYDVVIVGDVPPDALEARGPGGPPEPPQPPRQGNRLAGRRALAEPSLAGGGASRDATGAYRRWKGGGRRRAVRPDPLSRGESSPRYPTGRGGREQRGGLAAACPSGSGGLSAFAPTPPRQCSWRTLEAAIRFSSSSVWTPGRWSTSAPMRSGSGRSGRRPPATVPLWKALNASGASSSAGWSPPPTPSRSSCGWTAPASRWAIR
ncbi:MAG: hypothetical protein KatS3mg115_1883 [Candidatus Poribacteria bacterium]|nr:MAG: hypothetical protein KatS3mg115_1883 [Candidatus Poribacteria bacterium]